MNEEIEPNDITEVRRYYFDQINGDPRLLELLAVGETAELNLSIAGIHCRTMLMTRVSEGSFQWSEGSTSQGE